MTDKTKTERIRKRRSILKKMALSAGWSNWSEFETAVINKGVKLPVKK